MNQNNMNYFQLYETQRKRFSKGAKWIRWNGDIVEIIDTFEYSVSYKSMTGRFIVTGRSKDIFLHNFKPYNETST